TNATNISNNATAIGNNSNAIVAYEVRLDTAESDISTNQGNISTNAGDISTNQTNISNNATAIDNNSNAIAAHEIRLDMAEGDISNNATAIETNSESISDLIDCCVQISDQVYANSNAIDYWGDRILENSGVAVAAWELALYSSMAIVANSLDLIFQNSLAINANRTGINANSLAIVANSWAIVANQEEIIHNSNAVDAQRMTIENNSNAIVANLYAITNNSNGVSANRIFIVNNSNAIVANKEAIENNSTSMISNRDAIVDNSNAIVANNEAIANNSTSMILNMVSIENNSSAIVANKQAIINNSSAIMDMQDEIELVVSVSKALSYWAGYVINNSEAIVALEEREFVSGETAVASELLYFIHGPKHYNLSNNTTLTVDVWLSNDHKFGIDANMTLDGDGHAVTFAKNNSGVLEVGDNSLILKNITLRNFSPSVIGMTTGSVTFGDGTVIEMMSNNALTTENYTMSCDGFVEMNCHGNEFDISGLEQAIDVLPGATLSINNARICGLCDNNLRCVGPDSTITLSNCELILENDYSFTRGHLKCCQDVAIRGPERIHGDSLIFSYRSPQGVTIHRHGYLMVDRDVTFKYDPVVARKDLIVMEDETSILHLNGCSLVSTATSPIITGGRLIIEDAVTVQNDAINEFEALVLKDPIEIDVLSGGVIDLVDGLLEYQ
ncbi:hypothetical protein KKA53_01310, partial [Candidatus Dependentiae bacterium]|nr:hypothetical protein [Candidatus Dependentiae bacterium]